MIGVEAVLIAVYALLLLIQLGNVAYLIRSAAPAFSRAAAVPDRTETAPGPHPFVSILIPARNEAANLRRLLPSILEQEHRCFEILVYDDASEDDTWNVLESFDDDRLRPVRGEGPPEGWIGKVHALYRASKRARGDLFLFLDADAELVDPGSLGRLIERYHAIGPNRVLTGFTDLRGSGLLLVSLLPHTVITLLPWFLVERMRSSALGSLNGQCWMIDAETYVRLAPHEHVRAEVLEDVAIGRYLKRQGIDPVMANVRREVAVYMYESFQDAWRGFRKNAYLLMGGRVWTFVPWFAVYVWAFALLPFVRLEALAAVYVLKIVSDRTAGMPLWVTALGPLVHVAGALLQLDSAITHWTGRATWKGRRVG